MYSNAYIRRPPNEAARSLAAQVFQRLFEQHNEGVENRFCQFSWLKTELTLPSFQHLAFSYKNAVFAVLVDVVSNDGHELPELEREILCRDSLKYNLVPCIFTVKSEQIQPDASGLFAGKVSARVGYRVSPVAEGWNLCHARTGDAINPVDFGKDIDTPMSEWELQNFAIGVVRKLGLQKDGFIFDSYCDIPGINPQITFHDKEGRQAWAVVRFQSVLDESEAVACKNALDEQLKHHPHLAKHDGYFAPVSATMSDPVVRDRNGEVIPLSRRFDGSAPLYRGHGMYINFRRMIRIHEAT